MFNKSLSYLILPLIASTFVGCTALNLKTNSRTSQEQVRADMVRQQQIRDIEIAKVTAQSVDQQIQQVHARINNLEQSVQGNQGLNAEIAMLRKDIETLQGNLARSRGEQEKMRSDIISEVSRLFADQQKKAAASQSRSYSQSGYEHKVESGQTLSQIAAAYKVSVAKIKKANNLKSDVIRIGQKLFIPD